MTLDLLSPEESLPSVRVRDLSELIKAYDVRGLVPSQLDEGLARELGAAFVQMLVSRDGARPERVVVGRDMRPSGVALSAAFTEGVTGQGVDVVDVGLASTDQLYFASGFLQSPGAMFTASHNPAAYNGIKLCRAGAAPVGTASGLADMREMLERGDVPSPAGQPGSVSRRDLLEDYAGHLRRLVDVSGVRPLTVVVDAGNGMAGHTVPAVLGEDLPLTVVPLYFELDGTFPNHEANPIEPANLRDLQAKVVELGADLGLAFDGDADRCFVVDEQGEPVSPSLVTALIAERELAKERAAGREHAIVIHNAITSWTVREVVREHGGEPVRTRVGHSFIKAEMARTGAVFGGEHSGHFYFRDFWFADSGMLAALHTIAALGGQDLPLSTLVRRYQRYTASGEINSTVTDQRAATERVRAAFLGDDRPASAGGSSLEVDELDGMTVAGDTWWFNVRPSNTEPLLRLNVEASNADQMAALRDDVLALIRA